MAFTYEYTGVGNPSTVRRNDGREFPQHPANVDYLQWIADGGDSITDPAPTVTIEDRRTLGKASLARLAASASSTLTSDYPRDALYNALRYKEAEDYERFETDDTNDDAYVLLGSEVDSEDSERDTVDKVHDLVLAELAALKTSLATIQTAYAAGAVEIDGCDTQAEIDAVLAAADFEP